MRGASAAKRAFDLRCLDVRVEAKGNSLRSLPSSGALRHLLPQAGEGLGWPGFARGPRIGENGGPARAFGCLRSEEHTSELQSLMRISYAVFCLKKKNKESKHPLQHSQIYEYIQH